MKHLSPSTFFVFLAFTAEVWALSVPQTYRSGPEICNENKASRPNEISQWVPVPVSYKHSSKERSLVYSWTHKKFDPKKKSVIFVAGGPGDTSHNSFFDLKNWNVIFFDQRGNSCSRPATRELYLSHDFYSSENTARDIEEIRKAYKIDQISIYGVSYGTVPAHLYGHLFPETTRAIVLEGVISEGGENLMGPKRRIRILQRFFDSLPVKSQDRILELSKHPQIAKNWFSNVGMMMLYLDRPFESFQQFLDNVIWDEATAIELLKSFERQDPEETEYGFGHVMMGMIGCQEMGMNLQTASFYSVFEGRKLISDQKNHLKTQYCEPLGFQDVESSLTYRSFDYPSKTPTTYFQGVLDGATVAPNAVQHFKTVARGFAQLVLIPQGGHLPVHGPMASGYEKGAPVETRSRVLQLALDGSLISKADLSALIEATSMKWLLHSKDTN